MTFVVDGEVDLRRILCIFCRKKFEGVLIPGHSSRITCSAPWHADIAQAMGFMRAVIMAFERGFLRKKFIFESTQLIYKKRLTGKRIRSLRRSPFHPMQVAPRDCGLYSWCCSRWFSTTLQASAGLRTLPILEEGTRNSSFFPCRKGQIPLILEKFNLKGKTALVTGSSRGLGAAIAVALAQAGAQVAVHGSAHPPAATQQRVAKIGTECLALAGDVGDPAVCALLVEETVSHFGAIDILVNNAGIIRRSRAIDHSEEDWKAVIDVDLSSVFRLTQHAGRHMLAKGSGKIINIASLLSFQGGIMVASYAAAKGGLAQLTKAFANEWASKGINVNAIAPGYFATDNTEALRKDPERARQILERIPAGRWGSPEDLAGAAVFLASAASDYVHGHVLVVDGGWLNR